MFTPDLISNMKRTARIVVLTGAGVSAESGVPTFRGEDGLWKKFRPEELASFDAFISNPRLVWEWYSYRRRLISEVKPNPGHYALARMEDVVENFCLVTQNVDGLHRSAGSRRILELHGNIMRNRCMECGRKDESADLDVGDRLPRCRCGGLMRPDVVWFGEMLPQEILNSAFREAEEAEVFLSIGTSAVVQPAASLPLVAKRNGAYVVEINMESTPITSQVDETILGKSGEILPRLVGEVWGIEI